MLVAGRYELVEELGRGGAGAVFRARDRSLKRPVAFKRLAIPNDSPQRKRLQALFEREYRTLVELAHPHIVTAYDYGTDTEGCPFYVMELLEGADMRELAPLPYPEACRYAREVAASLALLHARRLLHRDVTPRNVRLVEGGHCKLLDFGLLAAIGDRAEAVGTPPCMPPEALEGAELDQRADLYALGALLYCMLTGKHAYPASAPQQLPTYWSRSLSPPSACLPERGRDGAPLPAIPRELDELVVSLLRPDRLARPASAGAVIDRLEVILSETEGTRGPREELELAESYLASAPLVGRARELTFMKQVIERLPQGEGAALLFEGPRGIGKTRLLRELALEARLHGASVVQVDAEQHDRPYGTAAALGRQLLEVTPSEAHEAAREGQRVLAHVVPELLADLSGVGLAERPDDAAQWRGQLQAALRAWILTLARKRPLLIAADNFAHCDEPSALLLASLALESKHEPLVILVSSRSDENECSPAGVLALRQVSRTSALTPLNSSKTSSLCAALFGEATNLARLSQFLHSRAAGNPAQCMELLRVMIANGHIRYRDGTWILPTEPAALELPAHLDSMLLARLARLGEGARALGRGLALYPGALTLEVCKALAGGAGIGGELSSRIDELLARGVLAARAEGYGFRHEAVRAALAAEIPPEQKPAMHRRVADAILGRGGELFLSERLQAALHLLHAGDERGARMLGEGALAIATGKEPVGGSQATLEAALALYQRLGRDRYETALVLATLGTAAYMADRRLDRYEGALIEHFQALTGIGLAARLRRWLGPRAATWLGLCVAFLRYTLAPRRLRLCSFAQLVESLTGGLLGLCGKAAVCLDGAAIERVRRVLEPLAALGPRSAASFAYDYCRGLAMVTEDRYARTYAHFRELERRLAHPRGLRGMTQEMRRVLEGGVHYVLGVMEGFRGDPQALVRAQALEQSGGDVHELIAAQLRLQYYGFRGEIEPVRQAFERLEACAIHTGHAWQVETWAAIAINLFGGLWKDVITAKRSVDETERLMREIPSLERYAQSSRATYLLQRGELESCAELFETVLRRERPLERIGWSISAGFLADAYNQLGEHGRALQLCEQVLQIADPDDVAYAGLRLALEIPRCDALCALERADEAMARVEQLLAMYGASQNPLTLGTLYEAAARIALAQKDRKAFSRHLKQVELAFCPLGNPALIARYRNLTELGGQDGGMAATIAAMREAKAFEGVLKQSEDAPAAARHVLSWVMERFEGYVGYVFVIEGGGPRVLSATAKLHPRPEVAVLVQKSLASLGKKEDTTLCGVEVLTTPDGDQGVHLYLLSYLDQGVFHGEGALVLVGRAENPPRIRYELLQIAAQQLHRLRAQPESGAN